MLLQQSSVVRDVVHGVLRDILAESQDLILDADDCSALVGVFAIIGKEFLPLHELGYVIHVQKTGNEVVKVLSENSNHLLLSAFMIPSACIPLNPNDFTLFDNKVPLLQKIHVWAISSPLTPNQMLRQTDRPTDRHDGLFNISTADPRLRLVFGRGWPTTIEKAGTIATIDF
jgi:hypothetical protein